MMRRERAIPTTRRRLTARGEEQRRRMVDAAYEIISQHGFEGLRTRDVAARAGLNISTFHYYFPSKEDLVRSVAQRLLHEFKSASSHAGGQGDAVEQVRREFLDQAAVTSEHPATYVVLMEIFTRSLRDRKLRPVFSALLDVWESHIREYVSKGVQDGELSDAPAPKAAARALQCLLLGSAINALAHRDEVPPQQVQEAVTRWLAR